MSWRKFLTFRDNLFQIFPNVTLREEIFATRYFRERNFREKKFSRIRAKFAKISSAKLIENGWFAKISSHTVNFNNYPKINKKVKMVLNSLSLFFAIHIKDNLTPNIHLQIVDSKSNSRKFLPRNSHKTLDSRKFLPRNTQFRRVQFAKISSAKISCRENFFPRWF